MVLTPEQKAINLERRRKEQYNKTHKIIKGIDHKFCNKHYEYFPDEEPWFPATLEYFYKNKTNSIDGLNTRCKRCEIQKAIQQWKDDPIKHREAHKRYEKTPKFKKWMRKNQEDQKENKVKYRKENKDKMKIYSQRRQSHKKHNITKQQLEALYKFANNSCMYCGLSEKEHKLKFKEKLHKDHAINDGNNTIDNCILACKSCNSEKHKTDWNLWYAPDNPKYTKEKYNNIKQWLEIECKKFNFMKVI